MTTKQYIDTLNLSGGPQFVEGQVLSGELTRLVQDFPAQGDSAIQWSLSASIDNVNRRVLEVRAQGSVVLECQRCMKPFVWPVDISNMVEVVTDEAQLEDDGDADGPDRILCNGRLDALGLVEDELILSIPYVPMHDVCPDTLELSTGEPMPESRPSPFAVLGELKKS